MTRPHLEPDGTLSSVQQRRQNARSNESSDLLTAAASG